jgi:hypothetical protein
MLEIRRHSYSHKAAILHIDRRKEFKRKLTEKELLKKEIISKNNFSFKEKF